MKAKNFLLSVVSALALTAGAGFAADPGVTDTEIRIGEILPLTGPGSFAGEAHLLGTKLALAVVNEAGGIAGRKVVAITEDDGYVPARSFQAAQKLVNVDKVFAITGTSGTTHLLAMMPLLKESGMLTIVSINTSEAAYDPVVPHIFAVGTSYSNVVHNMLKYVQSQSEKKDLRVGIIYQEDDFGAAVKAGFERGVKEFGLTNVVEIPFKRGQKDFAAEMLRVSGENLDFLVSGGIVSENVAVMKEAQKLGLDKMGIGTVWTAHLPIVQQLAGEAGVGYLTGDYVAATNDTDAAEFMAMAGKYLSADELKKVNRYTMTAYAGASLLIQGIQKCEADLTRSCVAKALESGETFNVGSIIEPLTFSADRHFSNSAPRVLRSDPAAGGFVKIAP